MVNDPITITNEQLDGWAQHAEPFPPYWEGEHDEYIDAMATDLLATRARIAELDVQLDRVREVHQPIEALNIRYPGGRLTEVCTGCGTDDGNWQTYPCPTIRALNGPRQASRLREAQP